MLWRAQAHSKRMTPDGANSLIESLAETGPPSSRPEPDCRGSVTSGHRWRRGSALATRCAGLTGSRELFSRVLPDAIVMEDLDDALGPFGWRRTVSFRDAIEVRCSTAGMLCVGPGGRERRASHDPARDPRAPGNRGSGDRGARASGRATPAGSRSSSMREKSRLRSRLAEKPARPGEGTGGPRAPKPSSWTRRHSSGSERAQVLTSEQRERPTQSEAHSSAKRKRWSRVCSQRRKRRKRRRTRLDALAIAAPRPSDRESRTSKGGPRRTPRRWPLCGSGRMRSGSMWSDCGRESASSSREWRPHVARNSSLVERRSSSARLVQAEAEVKGESCRQRGAYGVYASLEAGSCEPARRVRRREAALKIRRRRSWNRFASARSSEEIALAERVRDGSSSLGLPERPRDDASRRRRRC